MYQLKQEFPPPNFAPRTLTSEDLEEMSNQLHSGGQIVEVTTSDSRGDVTTESTHKHVSTGVTHHHVYPQHVDTSSYKLQHIDSHGNLHPYVKPNSDEIEYKIQHVDTDVEIKTLPESLRNLGAHHTYKNKNHQERQHIEIYQQPSETVVRRVGSVSRHVSHHYQQHYPSETQGTQRPLHSRHQNQRVRALRRRKLATQRRTRDKMVTERVTTSEFMTADGKRFEHN